ncbi:MAG: Cna B-type domain-containing protein [Firmicutes bacterium]|nr:Cna B-type domain-containing protein [Bacillota bacterium]
MAKDKTIRHTAGAAYTFDIQVVDSEGNPAVGTMAYAAKDLDLPSYQNIWGRESNDPFMYSEGLSILSGSQSYALVPEYNHSNATTLTSGWVAKGLTDSWDSPLNIKGGRGSNADGVSFRANGEKVLRDQNGLWKDSFFSWNENNSDELMAQPDGSIRDFMWNNINAARLRDKENLSTIPLNDNVKKQLAGKVKDESGNPKAWKQITAADAVAYIKDGSYAVERNDGDKSYDTAFAVLIDPAKATFRWTGSSYNSGQAVSNLFDSTLFTYIEQTHGTGGGIYFETYDVGDDCKVNRAEGTVTMGKGTDATVTVVPEDGYRIDTIKIGAKALGNSSVFNPVYDASGAVTKIKDNAGTEHPVTEGKVTITDTTYGEINFEVNTGGSIDVTLPNMDVPRHVHADFTTDYYFYKVWKSTTQEPTSLKLTATPYAYKFKEVTIDGTKYTISGNTFTGGGKSYTLENNALRIGDNSNITVYYLEGNDLVSYKLTDPEDPDSRTVDKRFTIRLEYEKNGEPVEFEVIKTDADNTEETNVIAETDADGYPVWKIRYPAAGYTTKGGKTWPALPIETKPSAHNINHVERNYWFVTEDAPGWALVEYDNVAAEAPGVIDIAKGRNEVYQVASSGHLSAWALASSKDVQKSGEVIKDAASSNHAYMSVFSDHDNAITKHTDTWGGKIVNIPLVVVNAEKTWEDFSNAFDTRQDVWFHIDATINGTKTNDILPPQKLAATEIGDIQIKTWGNKKAYGDDYLSEYEETDYSNVKVVGTTSDLPKDIYYARSESNPHMYVPMEPDGYKEVGGVQVVKYKPAESGTIYYVNELTEVDGEGETITYTLRETNEEGTVLNKSDETVFLTGYKTEIDDDGKATLDTEKATVGEMKVNSYTGRVKNTLETIDFGITKIWNDSKKESEHTKAEIEGMITLYDNNGAVSDKGEFKYNEVRTTTPESGRELDVKWVGLPAYINVGGEIVKANYYVTEKVPNNYKATYTNIDDSETTDVDESKEEEKALNSGEIENTELIDIKVTKVWDDNNNQDGLRDDAVVTLYKKVEGETEEVEVEGHTANVTKATSSGEVIKEWKGIPAAEKGKKITYSVKEEKIKDYETEITGDQKTGFTITNIHKPEEITIQAEKIWDDLDNKYDLRKDVTFTLLADSESINQDKTIKSTDTGDALKVSWTVPKYKAGKEIVYTLKESNASPYSRTIDGDAENGFIVTNKYPPKIETTTVTRTITYTYLTEDGTEASKTVEQKVNLQRLPKVVDEEGGVVEWEDWTIVDENPQTNAVTSPSIKGWEPDEAEIPVWEIDLTQDTPQDEHEHVVYLPGDPTVEPLVSKDGQYSSEDGSIITQRSGRPNFATETETLPDGSKNTFKIELDVPDGVEGAVKNPDGSVTVPGQGTYKMINEFGEIEFTPEEGFTGKADGVKIVGTDKLGNKAETTYTPIVVPNKETVTFEHVVEYRYLDENGNEVVEERVETKTVERIGDYDPSKDDHPEEYKDTDSKDTVNYDGPNTKWTSADFKEEVSPEDPDDGGWTPNKDVVDAINGINPDNAEENGFVQTTDPETGETKWVKRDIVIYNPEPPTPEKDETWGAPKENQSVSAKALFKVTTPLTAADENGNREKNDIVDIKLIDPDTGKTTNGPVNAYAQDGKTVVGTYTYDPSTGKIVFSPRDDFDGAADPLPAKLVGVDKNGKTSSSPAEYQPHFAPAAESKTVKRTIYYKYDDGTPVLDENGEPRKVEQEVTFTRTGKVDPDTGEVTWGEWAPESGNMDEVPSPKADRDGYVPGQDTVEAIPDLKHSDDPEDVTIIYTKPPTAEDKKTFGPKGDPQKGTPPFTEGSTEFTGFTLLDEDGEPTDTITIPGEGTYTVNPETGEVTFTPEPDFVGEGTGVDVQGTDKNGNTAVGRYTPTIVDTVQTETVKRTINYVYDDGTPVTEEVDDPENPGQKKEVPVVVVEEKTFTRTGKVDPETGTVTWESWEPQDYKDEVSKENVPKDVTNNYRPDKEEIAGTPTTPDKGDESYTVVYRKRTFTVTYLDGDHGKSDGKGDEGGKDYGSEHGAGNGVTPDEGYEFTGTYTYTITQPDGTVVTGETDDPASIPVTGDIVFTPEYRKTYWVTYIDPDGTTIYLEKTTQPDGDDEPQAPPAPTKDGYTFNGWTKEVDEHGNITYIANWTPNPKEPENKPTPGKTPTENAEVAAKTGDGSLQGLWIGVFMTAVMMVAAVLAVRKKKME